MCCFVRIIILFSSILRYCAQNYLMLILDTLKGNCRELRLWQHARFSGHFSFTESVLLSGVICFAAKGPSYASGFTLHRCRLESNLKSSDCLFQVNCSWQSPFKVASRAYSKIRRWHLRHMFTRNSIKTSLIRNMSNSKASGENQTYKLTQM